MKRIPGPLLDRMIANFRSNQQRLREVDHLPVHQLFTLYRSAKWLLIEFYFRGKAATALVKGLLPPEYEHHGSKFSRIYEFSGGFQKVAKSDILPAYVGMQFTPKPNRLRMQRIHEA